MEIPKITCITPTIRKDGLKIIHQSLLKQTYKDWEWLIGSPFDPQISEAKWVKDDFEGGYWSLNRIYNKLFKQAQGDIIVSWQDWIWVSSDGLQKFVDAMENIGEGIISGVGDQYEKLNKFGKPEVKIWSDPRKNTNNGSFYEIFPNDAEWNWCAFPKKYIFEVGGMDEELDFLCRGVDAITVNERWDALGKKFFLDQSNESFTLRHDRSVYGGEDAWNNSHGLFNGVYQKHKQKLLDENKWPVLNYLKEVI